MLPTKFHFHLAERFQRRRLKCEKLTEDRRWTPSDGKSSHCLWQSELKSPDIYSRRYNMYTRTSKIDVQNMIITLSYKKIFLLFQI